MSEELDKAKLEDETINAMLRLKMISETEVDKSQFEIKERGLFNNRERVVIVPEDEFDRIAMKANYSPLSNLLNDFKESILQIGFIKNVTFYNFIFKERNQRTESRIPKMRKLTWKMKIKMLGLSILKLRKKLIIINVLNQSLKDIYLKRKKIEISDKIYERQEAEIEGGLWQDFDLDR